MSNNIVTFKVAGNDVLTFMDQVKKKSDAQTAEMIANAKRQGAAAKDQIRDIEAQVKALERRNKLEFEGARQSVVNTKNQRDAAIKQEYENKIQQIKNTEAHPFSKSKWMSEARETMEVNLQHSGSELKDELKTLREDERLQQLQVKMLRDNIDTIKATSSDQVQQMRRSNTDVVEAIDEDQANDPKWKLANQAARDEYNDTKGEGLGRKLVGGMLNVSNIQSLMGAGGQLASSQSGFDMIQPAAKGAGNIIGTIIGGIVGSFVSPGAGTLIGAGIGGQIASAFGDTIGQFEQRRLLAAQEFLGGKAKYEATTQLPLGDMKDMTKMGIGVGDYVTILREIATNTASTAMAAENTKDAIELERGAGISKDVSTQMMTYFRGTNKDISNLVGGIMMKGKAGMFGGGDYTFLNEFMQKFNSLHNELRNSSEKVATGTTFDILSMFNKVGGQFATRDTRSMGLINTINGALANPGSDSMQAMSFLALRKDNPQMTFAQLQEERQKGLASPAYLKSMLKMVDDYGGDRSSKITNLTALTGGNFAAARRLWDNREEVGRMSTEEIENKYSGDFTKAAESHTTLIEQNMASIKNGLLSTWNDGVDSMVEAFGNALTEAMSGAVINIGENGTITLATMKTNVVRNNVGAPTPTEDITGTKSFTNGRLRIGHANHK